MLWSKPGEQFVSASPIPVRRLATVYGRFLLLAVVKTFLAFKLDLYSDEIFYWLASTQLALGYSDLPFMTALLVRLGSSLTDGSALAVRSIFLVMGSTVPLLVYWLAYPITGKQAARQSALISLCLPLGGFLGLLAYLTSR